ncbi:MAG TPA: hypothetical protein VHM48_10065 [Candidatus Limnocylindrales bacterium]|nr:hypothetical protein [Candidatus Limnocylindrales bacterium]
MTDPDLEGALRDLGGSLATPFIAGGAGVLDPARRARLRIERGAASVRRQPRWAGLVPSPRRPFGRGVGLGLVLLVVLAAVAGAIGLGLPGIRILQVPSGSAVATAVAPSGSPTFSAPSRSPGTSASPAPGSPFPAGAGTLGGGLGLGDPIAVSGASSAVDIPVLLPSAQGVGSPVSAWLLDGRLALVWRVSSALPATREPGVGLILSEFRGSLEPGYFEKIIGPDTTVDPVTVDGVTGYWISGAPHEIVFVGTDGQPVFDSRRIVGDTLIWARGDVTYRLESGLDRAAAIALAETLR